MLGCCCWEAFRLQTRDAVFTECPVAAALPATHKIAVTLCVVTGL
jgi:hypothetical protein